MNHYCLYYQAQIQKERCWFFTAVLRSNEHVAFDRTVDVEHSILEFFVPEDTEARFLHIMNDLATLGLVTNLVKLPNRLS